MLYGGDFFSPFFLLFPLLPLPLLWIVVQHLILNFTWQYYFEKGGLSSVDDAATGFLHKRGSLTCQHPYMKSSINLLWLDCLLRVSWLQHQANSRSFSFTGFSLIPWLALIIPSAWILDLSLINKSIQGINRKMLPSCSYPSCCEWAHRWIYKKIREKWFWQRNDTTCTRKCRRIIMTMIIFM